MTQLRKLAFPAAAACLALLSVGCPSVECSNGTVEMFDKMSGRTLCVTNPSKVGVQCDLTTSTIQAGLCRGDPTKFPTCGSGTKLMGNTCVSTGGGMAKTCDSTQAPGTFCVGGSIHYLKDESLASGKSLVVTAYNPIAFLMDPKDPAAVIAPPQTTDDGTYAFNGLMDTAGVKLVAIGVQDAAKTEFALAGAGANNVIAGNNYVVDIYVIESTLVASWETQAGIPTGMLLQRGAYLAKFLDSTAEAQANHVSGVVLDLTTSPAPNQYYFKGDLLNLDKNATATDRTGAVLHWVPNSNLTSYTGTGGPCGTNITWETAFGTSAPGVVFVSKFHPMM